MTLDAYLTKKRLTEVQFAELVGLSQPQVNRLRRGIGLPSRKTLRRIMEATNRKVRASDFAWAGAEAA